METTSSKWPDNKAVDYTHLQELFASELASYTAGLDNNKPCELYEPEKYILSLGGKRVRPMLCLVGSEVAGGDPRKALACAMAVELFHNFSLIHDDILDQAPLRRGKPTAHIRYGTNTAILCGDAMLVKSFSFLSSYDSKLFSKLSQVLQRTAIEVCEGQQLDMNFEGQETVSVEDYVNMIRLKTAVLLGCSLEMGAITAEADNATREALYAFGVHVGIAFQLLDDLLDCFPEQEAKFGKRRGGDIAANKKTFLWLKAIELANTDQAGNLRRLSQLQANNDSKIEETLSLFKELGVDRLCREEADRHTKIAVERLHLLNCDEEKKKQLEQFAMQLLHRQS